MASSYCKTTPVRARPFEGLKHISIWAFQQVDSRDHLLKLVHRSLHLGSTCDIVLNLVDERRKRYTPWVGGRIFAGEPQLRISM